MNRVLTFGLFVLMMAAPAFGQIRRVLPRSEAPIPPRMVMERLNRMSPEEREHLLSKLPPERRAALEERLRRYDELPPAVKDRLRKEYDDFQQLPPGKQDDLRKMFRQMAQLPPERRKEVQREITRLRRMSPERREARMASDKFRDQYSDQERQMMEGIVGALPPSPPPGS